ncbi:MAG: FMN-binding protein, partial [Clostridia bacterium]|nr:FMN-binding protein [Clostridia bacterium]
FILTALTLFIITALVAGLLALANFYTAPIIEQSAKERLDHSLSELITDAVSFEEAEEFEKNVTFGSVKVPVHAIYVAKDAAGTRLGYCVRVTPAGYSDVIDMLVAIDGEGAVSGVQILAISDTPGIGMKVESDETFRSKLIGITDTVKAVKTVPAVGEVQVISGATVSSTAYINGVNAALEAARLYEQEVAK